MLISTKGYYALKVILFFAFSRKISFSIKEISKRTGISEKVLEQVLLSLKKKGLLFSKRGPNGGYTSNVDFRVMSINDIIDQAGAALEIFPQNNKMSENVIDDALMKFASELEKDIKKKIGDTSVNDLIKDMKEKVTQDGLNFMI